MATVVTTNASLSQVRSDSDISQIGYAELRYIKIIHITAGSTTLALAEMKVYMNANPKERLIHMPLSGATTVFLTIPQL